MVSNKRDKREFKYMFAYFMSYAIKLIFNLH